MAADDKMTLSERFKYLSRLQNRYLAASRSERSALLNEVEPMTELHRKSLIRLLHSNLTRKHRTRQRGRSYGPDVEAVVGVIAESLDHPCAERLQACLPAMAAHLAQHGELTLSPGLLAQLARISVSTLRRMLRRSGRDQPRLPRRPPAPANPLLRHIPARTIPWHEPQPGHFEVDLVHHCGPSPSGLYLHTLQLVDVATGWSERVAILGRSFLVMQDAFQRILTRLPFPIRELHPDNGAEFLNHYLLRYWKQTIPQLDLSRSRPFAKNDNRFVEQKNGSWVRAYLGDQRLDTARQTNLLNQIYDRMWLHHNFFVPVLRLQDKTVLPADGQATRVRRHYGPALSPLDRLLRTDALSSQELARLQALRVATNPRQLRREVHDLLDRLVRLPGAKPNKPESAYHTLFHHSHTQKGDGGSVTLSFG